MGRKKTTTTTTQTSTKEIQELLLDIGMPSNLAGFQYITYAIQLALDDEAYLYHVTKLLYIDVAQKFHTNPSSIERCIRHAINVAWMYGSMEEIKKLFRNSVNPNKGVPTNSQFLARLHFYIVNNMTNKSA